MLAIPLFALLVGAQPAPLPRASNPALHQPAVDALLEAAKKQKTDTLLVIHKGEVVLEHYAQGFDAHRPLETMSVTKSIAALAVGLRMADGKIDTLEAPLARWLPACDTDVRRGITVCHVLTQSTGLLALPGANELYAQADRSAYAQTRPVVEPPGKVFAYNNAGTQLLEPPVQAACGERIDRYVDARLFQPLGITTFTWQTDEAGHPTTFAGLHLSAEALGKIGLLVLHRGQHDGKQLLPAAFVEELGKPNGPNPGYGLLWWLIADGSTFVQPPARLARLTASGLPGRLAAGHPERSPGRAARPLLDGGEAARPQRGQRPGREHRLRLPRAAGDGEGHRASRGTGTLSSTLGQQGFKECRGRRARDRPHVCR